MAKSNRLRLGEIKAAFRLVAEARDLGADPDAWRGHVVRELRRRIGGTVAMTVDMHDFLPGRLPRLVAPIDLGWDSDRERRLFLYYLDSDLPKIDPSAVAWVERMGRRRYSAASRSEMIGDREWYASPIVSEGRRSCRIDDSLISCTVLGRPGRVQGFQFYRPWGGRQFTARDRSVVRLVHIELIRHMTDGPAAGAEALPPHLRRTLDALLKGSTAKVAARALGLSVHTVDGYRKAIYRHFGVGSLPQLLALNPDSNAPGRLRLPRGL
jgi:hypothetical protein